MQTIFGNRPAARELTPRFQLPLAPAAARVSLPLPARVPRAEPAPANARDGHAGQGDRGLIEALAHSKVYQEYERAFTDATGLPVALRAVESWQLPLHGKRREAPYCALLSGSSRACASCLQMQEKLTQMSAQEAGASVCASGLWETAIPVRLGDRLIGYLQTGQVFGRKPSSAQFERAAGMAEQWGVAVDRAQLKEAYFATPVVAAKAQNAAVTLLKVFAQHLSMLSNQVIVQQEHAEPPVITRAKAFIEEHHTEDIRLGDVARAVCTSPFYFCKIFKKATGINFTDYLSRVRVERSKNLLLNPNLRVSEIAYEVGFQSLTHFNRVFKRIVGQSPTDYREQLIGAA
jgi:AraC-like DNA-binding protein/ligand-binding sensor protein